MEALFCQCSLHSRIVCFADLLRGLGQAEQIDHAILMHFGNGCRQILVVPKLYVGSGEEDIYNLFHGSIALLLEALDGGDGVGSELLLIVGVVI